MRLWLIASHYGLSSGWGDSLNTLSGHAVRAVDCVQRSGLVHASAQFIRRQFKRTSVVFALGAALACVSVAAPAATEAELDAAYERMLNDPENLQAIADFARLATENGEYETAVGALERLLLFASDSASVRADLGFLYYRLGSYEIARYHLTQALESGKLAPGKTVLAERLVQGADLNTNRHHFSANLNFGLRYQTNPASAPSDDRILAGGNLVTLNAANQEDDDVDAFIIANGRYRYNFLTQNKAVFEAGFGLAVDRFADQDTLHNLTASFNPGIRFEPDPVDNKGLTLFPHLLSRVVQRSDDLLSHSFGVGLGLRYAAREDLLVSALVRHRRLDFHNSTERPTASDRDGFQNLFSAGLHYRLRKSVFGVLRGHVIDREADTGFNSNFEWGLSGRVIVDYTTKLFGGQSRGVSSYALLGFRDIRYSDPDPLVDARTKRNDHEYRLGLGSTLALDRAWSISVEGAATNVTSNIRNFVRDNLSISLSATRRF